MCCGIGGPLPGVGRAGCLLRGKYFDPEVDRDPYGRGNPAHGRTKISGNRPRGLAEQLVTSDLATCGPVRSVSVKHLERNFTIRSLWMGLTSVVTLARLGLTRGYSC